MKQGFDLVINMNIISKLIEHDTVTSLGFLFLKNLPNFSVIYRTVLIVIWELFEHAKATASLGSLHPP